MCPPELHGPDSSLTPPASGKHQGPRPVQATKGCRPWGISVVRVVALGITQPHRPRWQGGPRDWLGVSGRMGVCRTASLRGWGGPGSMQNVGQERGVKGPRVGDRQDSVNLLKDFTPKEVGE